MAIGGRTVGLGAMAFAVGLTVSLDLGTERDGAPSLRLPSVGVSTAEARRAPRAAVREDRRVTRRDDGASHTYFDTLPADCIKRGLYWYCGGVYYQKVDRAGREVYMVTTP